MTKTGVVPVDDHARRAGDGIGAGQYDVVGLHDAEELAAVDCAGSAGQLQVGNLDEIRTVRRLIESKYRENMCSRRKLATRRPQIISGRRIQRRRISP